MSEERWQELDRRRAEFVQYTREHGDFFTDENDPRFEFTMRHWDMGNTIIVDADTAAAMYECYSGDIIAGGRAKLFEHEGHAWTCVGGICGPCGRVFDILRLVPVELFPRATGTYREPPPQSAAGDMFYDGMIVRAGEPARSYCLDALNRAHVIGMQSLNNQPEQLQLF